jgi:hypothetical protein
LRFRAVKKGHCLFLALECVAAPQRPHGFPDEDSGILEMQSPNRKNLNMKFRKIISDILISKALTFCFFKDTKIP